MLLFLNVCQHIVALALKNVREANTNFAHGKMWRGRRGLGENFFKMSCMDNLIYSVWLIHMCVQVSRGYRI